MTTKAIAEYDEVCAAAQRIEALGHMLSMVEGAEIAPPLSAISQIGFMLLEDAEKIHGHGERLLDAARGE